MIWWVDWDFCNIKFHRKLVQYAYDSVEKFSQSDELIGQQIHVFNYMIPCVNMWKVMVADFTSGYVMLLVGAVQKWMNVKGCCRGCWLLMRITGTNHPVAGFLAGSPDTIEDQQDFIKIFCCWMDCSNLASSVHSDSRFFMFLFQRFSIAVWLVFWAPWRTATLFLTCFNVVWSLDCFDCSFCWVMR
jgi:hypothetical protein